MATGLIDTSVVVDLLRQYQPAEARLSTQSQLGVSRAVYFEIVEGVRNGTKLRAALKFLKHFELIEYSSADLAWATDKLTNFWLSHGIDGYDCLIAAPCHRLHLPPYTRNLK